MTLRWEHIEDAAANAFDIWTSGSDLQWANETWHRFEKLGFCDYDDEAGRHIVIGRWLALASIYRDWCAIVCDEAQEDDPGYWVEAIDVHDIYLGQLASSEQLSDDPDKARQDALAALMRNQRREVVQKLHESHGDRALLFMSFWKTANNSGVTLDDDDADEQAAEALSDPTPQHVAGWAWLEEGCPHNRPF